uniref:T9SS type A sorting domain-containing protein n=1 Tax=candidate division WOR-3 bacterium TaxID=2052148 RepID=A0A7C6AFY8_UNCW3
MKKYLFILVFILGFSQINWQIEIADSVRTDSGGIGWASLKLDILSQPRIVYYQSGWDTNWVKLIYLSKIQGQWIKETVDSSYGYTTTNYYVWPDLCLDRNDHPHIAFVHRYSDNTVKLFYAKKVTNYWSIQKLDSIPEPHWSKPSLALDTNDYPGITWAYRSPVDTVWRIKYFHWDGISWNSEIAYDGNDLPDFCPSLAVDFENRPHIVYYQRNPDSVKYAFWNGTNWQFWGDSTNQGMGGNYGPSLKLDSSGYPHFIHGWATNYVHWNGNFWESETTGAAGPLNYLDLDTDNLPHIAFLCDQRPAYCYRDSTGWHLCGYIEPDPYTVTGHSLSFCLDDNKPHVAYIGCGSGNWYRMKYAKGTFVGIEETDTRYRMHNTGREIEVSPTICHKILNIKYMVSDAGEVELAIYDVCGKRIKSMVERDCPIGDYKKTLNISDLACGVYFMVLKQNNEAVSKKFTIVR